jgi:hypothetical protein
LLRRFVPSPSTSKHPSSTPTTRSRKSAKQPWPASHPLVVYRPNFGRTHRRWRKPRPAPCVSSQ